MKKLILAILMCAAAFADTAAAEANSTDFRDARPPRSAGTAAVEQNSTDANITAKLEAERLAKLRAEVAKKNQRKPAQPLEKMVGQMIAVGFEGTKSTDDWVKLLQEQIREGEVGSVVVFARNVASPQETRSLMESLHRVASNPPLWAMIDQEGGLVQRLSAQKRFGEYPSAKKMAAENPPQKAYEIYRKLACELRGYAINFNLAPVVDLDLNGSIISRDERAFSKDPLVVAQYAEQFIKAHNSCGVPTAIKHFPDQGGAAGDPHYESSLSVKHGADQDKAFKILIEGDKAHAVLVSHVISREHGNAPASLSKSQIKRLRDMGFDGVIISDDLQMGAVANTYSLKEIVISSINAGVDVMLFSNIFKPDRDLPGKVYQIVSAAIQSGEVDLDRVEESYARVAKLKKKTLQ
jgi:beta-N-acetylhexosaminidase